MSGQPTPMRLERSGDGFVVDAADLGPLLDLPPADVPGLMREGRITSVSETGTEDDDGRYRVSFRHEGTTVRLTLDASGNVLSVARTIVPPAPGR
ncbi:MAG: DUF6522 family protein [Jhaorihella sp.]